ncbi:MAG: hypothetical protein ACPHK8_00885, partial [Thermoplasmatota archaeon]
MKASVTSWVAIMLVLSLAGCTDNENNANAQNSSEVELAHSTPTPEQSHHWNTAGEETVTFEINVSGSYVLRAHHQDGATLAIQVGNVGEQNCSRQQMGPFVSSGGGSIVDSTTCTFSDPGKLVVAIVGNSSGKLTFAHTT